MTLNELDNLANMIKLKVESSSTTVLVNTVPYDVERTNHRVIRLWGMIIWERDFEFVGNITNIAIPMKTVGYQTTIDKNT